GRCRLRSGKAIRGLLQISLPQCRRSIRETRLRSFFENLCTGGIPHCLFLLKDPRGWQEFQRHLGEHSALGSALTMRGVQARRPSIYDLESRLRELTTPMLVIVGDEDDHCLQPGIFLKRTVPACGLLVMPKAGHTLNLEEPAQFNQAVDDFLATVAQGRWLPRDPRAMPSEIMKTS